ncbi:MAG: ABC transporter ATP-binding protein [Coprobacillus sp.]
MLKIEKLSKSFHKNIVLNDLNLDVQQGDLIYIHGINGSGKSTLFKIICGILEPDNGTVTKDSDIHIGALIENPGFIENESLHYNLKFLASLKHHFDEERIKELCELFHLDYQSKAKIKNYSLGMRQKTGIIQAIMEGQNFILLDEPTRGLDEEAVEAFCELINELNKQGKTIMIAAHDYLKQIPYNKTFHLKNGVFIQDEIS